MLIQACLNGARPLDEHPALPRAVEDFTREARRAIATGANALHLHPRDDAGAETFDAHAIATIFNAVRAACPEVAIGGTTGAWIMEDVAERLRLVERWIVLPDYVSVNLSEDGVPALAALLLRRGIGIEAGIATPADVRRLVEYGLAERCLRILIEPVEATPDDALRQAQHIEAALHAANIRAPRLLHGIDTTTWPVLRYALGRGYDIRIGLEDTLRLPDGTLAPHNGALVAAARVLAAR
jgi:uncharacterized protein (DUF849 family)